MEPIISFKDFSFQYTAQKQPTLKDISLDIYPGEKILICGASGSGKSTLGNCINGLIPFSLTGKMEGECIVDGISTKDSSIFELSTRVGTVLQDPDGQFVGLTVAEDIAFALENDCVEQEQMKKQILEAAKKVSIEHRMANAPYDLSGGQKQRVSMAGVIVDDVKILLFDEPLANLDPATGKSAIELIDLLKKETDTTVVIIEHRIEDVLWKKVDRMILMDDGRIIADLRPDELLCSDLLKKHGIREPLYLTLLKYAGVDVSKTKGIESINELCLNEDEKKKIVSWYAAQNKENRSNDNEVILKTEDLDFSAFTKNKYTEIIDYDKIIGTLRVRKPEETDTIVINSSGGRKKLSKLFTDLKVDRAERGSYPVVVDDCDVVWLPGLRMSEKYKLTPDSSRGLRMEYILEGGNPDE